MQTQPWLTQAVPLRPESMSASEEPGGWIDGDRGTGTKHGDGAKGCAVAKAGDLKCGWWMKCQFERWKRGLATFEIFFGGWPKLC